AWIRPKLDERVESLFRDGGQPFWILFVRAGLRRVEREYSKYAAGEVRKALVKRIEATLEGEAFVARWSEGVFAAVMETSPSTCQGICEEIRQKLAGAFSVQEDGTALTIAVEVRIGAVERYAGTEEAAFYLKLGEVSGELTQAS